MAEIRFRLESLLSTLTVVGAVAYSLGWLKSLYYFQTFGVGLELADLSIQDYLFESWFVIENLLFFLLLCWVVLKARSRWGMAVGLLYALLPISAHYAFSAPNWLVARIVIDYRHALLKFIPFFVLAVLWFFNQKARASLKDLSWPYSSGAFFLFLLVSLVWSVSAAKHFGSFDANRALQRPDDYFTRVQLKPSNELTDWDESRALYLLRATKDTFILLDLHNFNERSGGSIGLIVVPRDSVLWLNGTMKFQRQLGGQYI